MSSRRKTASDSSLSKTYQKLQHREQILLRPDSYIGSVENDDLCTYVFDDDAQAMVKTTVSYNPGLFKLVDEIIVNARDQHVRLVGSDTPVTEIRVFCSVETGRIKVVNNGAGIDVERHPEHKVYIPELIFGHLLTSTNYDKDEVRITGGKNGYGAKLTNIFSKEFVIETVDGNRHRKYVQRFYDNMTGLDAPIVTSCRNKPYTSVEFLPDYAKFGLKGLTKDMFAIIRKRAYDLCACTGEKVKIYFNGDQLHYKNFEKYVDLFIPKEGDTKVPRAYESPNNRWEVAATFSDNGFQQVSFVNGINTLRGGRHVDVVVAQICKKVVELVKSKKKKTLKQQDIKNYLSVFVNATIENPSFDGQIKETLTTNASKFGSKCELSDKFIDKVYKCGIVERAIRVSEAAEVKSLSKLDGKKKTRILGIEKLEDANKAGGRESSACTLVITEGDSAKAMAVDGVSVCGGRDYYGIFPLKGKPLNVKEATISKIIENKEISNLMKIIGLETNKKYKSTDALRYGRLMILADSDVDGSHIKGLIMNMIHSMWPTLITGNNFIVSMLTPMVKATKRNEVLSFYNASDYEHWKNAADRSGWHIKYYKGLGTSTSDEAKQYFREMKLVKYHWTDDSESALDLAFNKKRADDRKAWLKAYDPGLTLDYSKQDVTYDDFVHKDLIHFSNSDIERSIPSVCDGFKPSTRKILYGCIKKNLFKTEIKVSQLSGAVSEISSYHHGEASLQGAIVNMAQVFVGANNINLLVPSGQFGSRLQAGRDAASPRYIFTRLEDIVPKIFVKEDNDVLTYLDDDGFAIEPKYYVPIIPMVLVNGAMGIGTGFSTTIPSYNPKDIMASVERVCDILEARGNPKDSMEAVEENYNVIDSIELKSLDPWILGFTGSIYWYKTSYMSKGVYREVSPGVIEITELPVGTWTSDYKEFLEKLLADGKIKDYKTNCTSKKIRFEVVLGPMKADTNINEFLNLCSNKGLSVSNFHLYTAAGKIRKYEGPVEIIKDFCKVRLRTYALRKAHMLRVLRRELVILDHKCRFIQDVIDGVLRVMNEPTARLLENMKARGYDDDIAPDLIRMPISSLTREKKQELEAQLAAKKLDVKQLKETKLVTIWKRELDELAVAYDAFLERAHKQLEDDDAKPKAPRRVRKAK